ncbi:ATP-binding protein [Hwanghaeella grinnelliae]|uniref:ATP-binding protein n=1 Tax=Hwanghaeella grinnelliae TaxID=2500179 RepID=UPI0013875D5B|nr:ATP-binding protein [Hwanghaeella grinnelliae]
MPLRKPRLGQKLAIRLISVSILVTLVVGGLWGLSEYRSYQESLERSRNIYKAGKEELIKEIVGSVQEFIRHKQKDAAETDLGSKPSEFSILQNHTIELIERIRFGDGGYVFAGTFDGISLSGPAKGRNVLDVTDVNGVMVVQELIATARNGSGFVTYHVPASTGAAPIEKTSYVVGVPKWGWYIGAGYDLEKFENDVHALQEETEQRFQMILVMAVAVILVSVSFMIFFARREFRKIADDHNDFMEFFENIQKGDSEIDPATLEYAEFEQIGEAANRMVARRLKAEESLQISERNAMEKEQLLDSIFHNIPVGLMIKNRDHVVERVNAEFLSWIGYKAEDVVGKTVVDAGFIDSQYDAEAMIEQENHVFATGEILHRSVKQRFADGTVHRLLSTRFPIYDHAGKIVKIGSVNVDQTELLKALEAAESANKAKTEFLASMSHELRTPLNAVIGFSQMVGLDPKHPLTPSQKEYLDLVIQSGNHLLDLVNEVLDLSIIETGKAHFDIADVNVSHAVDHCLTMVSHLVDRNAITVTNNLHGTSVVLATDETRFKQILLNLITNAIKYNKVNGSLVIEGKEAGDNRYRISVTDTGHGIPDDEQDNIFKMFHQIGRSPDIAAEGTGIGLYVCKLLIDGMGGRIGFESTEEMGSTFWIELPQASREG